MSYFGSKVECGLDVLVLRPRRPPRVIQLEALVAEVGPAVSTAFGGLQSLRGFAELAHHSNAAQAHCVSVPGGTIALLGYCISII